MYSPVPISACDIDGNPIQQNPVWSREPFKLYTRCDDILIGINTPQYNLDVNGDGNFRGTLHTRKLKLGIESPGNALINGYWRGSNTSQMLLNIGFISNQSRKNKQLSKILGDIVARWGTRLFCNSNIFLYPKQKKIKKYNILTPPLLVLIIMFNFILYICYVDVKKKQ